MKIEEYCKINEISKAKLAEMCGISKLYLYNFLSNKSMSLPNAIALMLGTDGAIQPEDLIEEKKLNEIKQRIHLYQKKEAEKKERIRKEMAKRQKKK